MQTKRESIVLLFFSFLLMFSVSGVAVASLANNEVTVFDTVENFDSIIKVENVFKGQEFLFRIVSPDNRYQNLRGEAMVSGIYRMEIPGSVFKIPGIYSVSVFSGESLLGSESFRVYADEPSDMGGDFADVHLLSLATAEPRVSSLAISGLPATLSANQTTSFSVSAMKAEGEIFKSYAGTVRFYSPTDQNALVPADYTFQPSDLGEHAFQLSVSFKATGTQRLRVEDSINPDIFGEVQVMVTASKSVTPKSGSLRITSPSAGRYGVNILQINGEAPAGSSLTVFDNGRQIGVTRASQDGLFSFSTPLLADGEHSFSVRSGNFESDEIIVTIDATASELHNISLSKNPSAPGDIITITVEAESGLENVSATTRDLLIDLMENPRMPGTYQGQISVPDTQGSYPVDIRTIDRFGNESVFTEAETIRVETNLSSRISFRVPSRVANIRAEPGHGRVTLSWSASQDDTGIAYYRVYYGIHPDNLTGVVNTAGSRTEWYVPNLSPAVEYFFVVSGVDTDGNEGDQLSEPVSAIVLGNAGAVAFSESRFGDLANAGGAKTVLSPESLPQDGPSMVLLAFLSPLLAVFVRFRKVKEKYPFV